MGTAGAPPSPLDITQGNFEIGLARFAEESLFLIRITIQGSQIIFPPIEIHDGSSHGTFDLARAERFFETYLTLFFLGIADKFIAENSLAEFTPGGPNILGSILKRVSALAGDVYFFIGETANVQGIFLNHFSKGNTFGRKKIRGSQSASQAPRTLLAVLERA